MKHVAAAVLEELAFLTWLKSECGHLAVRPLSGGRYAAIVPFMFTFAIVTGRIGDKVGYDDRWCFDDLAKTRAAFEDWDGSGEPSGWHRHPLTGRRRKDGDPATEYVAP